jgi:hypothetical protein
VSILRLRALSISLDNTDCSGATSGSVAAYCDSRSRRISAVALIRTLSTASALGVSSFANALAIAEKRGDVNAQLQVLWARYASLATKGYYVDAIPSVEGVAQSMVEHPEIPATPLYTRMAAFTYHLQGEQQRALHHAELALDNIAVMQRASRDGVFVYDHKTTSSAH